VLLLGLALALAGCEPAWEFAVFGDSSPDSAEAPMPAAFGKIVERINDSKAELALFAGDLVRGRTIHREVVAGQYERALAAIKPLRARLLIVPGNHDVDGPGGAELFAQHFGKTPWVVVHRGWTFIGLNTELPGMRGMIAGEQLVWLQDRLAERKHPGKTVILMHRPIHPTLGPAHRYHSVPQPLLHELFRQEGVTAVFCGHEHHFHQLEKDGVLYITTGGAGADLLPGGFFHYVQVHVNGDRLSAKNVCLD